jgi:serine/threonine protein kinase
MEFDMLRMISLLTKPVADNIITLIAFYTWKNEIHFVFPFVESDLQSLLRDGWCPTLLTPQSPSQPLPDHWLWKQMIGVSEALSAIHTGLYNPFPGSDGQVIAFHFDLKPANILVTAEGVLKITDFGQSLLQIVDASGVYESGTPGGDLVYRAPESRPSKESMQSGQGSEIKMLLNYDVWSLACILMEVLVFILGRSVSPPVECPLADLDDRRSQEGPGIAYFGRNDVKACVKDELKNLRENLTVDDPSRQYMNSLIELLFSMFAMDNKNREFSGGVVSRLQKMHEKYDEDQQPEDPLIQLVKNAKQSNPAGHDEIGWVDSFDPVEPHAISFLYL